MERIKLTAREGMWLTDGEIFAKTVYLGTSDAAENWREVTEEAYQAAQTEVIAIDER